MTPEHAAIEAREQQDFIREWLNAGDVKGNESAVEILLEHGGVSYNRTHANNGAPKFSTEQKAREWVDSHGGPDVVRERLARGWV